MSTSFPFKFVNKGMPVAFKIEANSNFPNETEPECILTNLGGPAAPDTFITVGIGVPPNEPDPWELTFRWETVGGPAAGEWQLDAFLESVSGPGPNLPVVGLPLIVPGVTPAKHDVVLPIPPNAIGVPAAPGVHLYRLYATLRWAPLGLGAPVVRVAGRAEGPLIEFYNPA
jgi:hypothetical protein